MFPGMECDGGGVGNKMQREGDEVRTTWTQRATGKKQDTEEERTFQEREGKEERVDT
jgi:hypothetical protein